MLPAGGDQPVDNIEGALLDIRNASYICLVTLVLILYDHILTFRVELASFWTLGFTWLRGLFFLNRYLSIVLAVIQLYSITSEELSASHRCAGLTSFIVYGTVVIVTFSSIVQFTRVYILYKPQRPVIVALMTSMLILWGTLLAFVIMQERALIFLDDSLPTLGPGCRGCRPSGSTSGHDWAPFVPLLIQQTILAGMILFKGFKTPAKGEHAKGVMGPLMRDGAIVYLVILLSLTICFFGATIKSLGIPLFISSILLPVFSLCTTRLLVNLRGGPHPYPYPLAHPHPHRHHHHHHNNLFSGVEMTGLYLGGYLGGIAPARGVEGAIVTEIGNTTIIEVPVIEPLAPTDAYAARRGSPSRCGGGGEQQTADEGGLSECHASMMTITTSPPLKVSALGATPGWEHWDHRLPTKDFKLPSVASSSSSSPPQERGLHFEDEYDDGNGEDDVLHHHHHHQRRISVRSGSMARRRSQNRASDRRGSGRSNSTLVGASATSMATTTTTTPGGAAAAAASPPSSIPSTSELERPGTSGTQRTLVHKSSNYASGWSSRSRSDDHGKGGVGAPNKPPPSL